MKTKKLSITHKEVIKVLKKDHLTSFEILNRIKNISLILVIYNIIDELKSMGILKTYVKEDTKYHYLA